MSSARFDPATGRRVIHVVYDGARGAGKTTNVAWLGHAFEHARLSARRSRELAGATTSFDWLALRAGVRDGLPVQVTVIGTPGLRGLAARRARIIAEADVVVLVCDATQAGLRAARRGSSFDGATPVVVQANHQDRPGAADARDVAVTLGLPDAPAFGAVARSGRGVVDTFLAALRAAHEDHDERRARGERVVVGPALSPARLATALEQVPVDTAACAEHLLLAAAISLGAR